MRTKIGGAGGNGHETVTTPDVVANAGQTRSTSGPAVTPPEWAPAVAVSRVREAEEKPAKPKNTEALEKWARIRVEAEEKYGPGLFGLNLWQDAQLVKHRIPPTSPWWKWTIRTFLSLREADPLLQWIVALVGRGGGKSTTLEKLMLIVVLFIARKALK